MRSIKYHRISLEVAFDLFWRVGQTREAGAGQSTQGSSKLREMYNPGKAWQCVNERKDQPDCVRTVKLFRSQWCL